MDKREKKRILKRRRREVRFARKTAVFSLIIAVMLTTIAAFVYSAAPSFLESEIEFAIEKRAFDRARKIAGYLGEDSVILTDKKITYVQAEELLNAGDFDGASALFRTLGDYEDASVRIQQAGYMKAQKAFEGGKYEDAILLFNQVNGYSDAMYKISKSKYILAEQALANGEYNDAMERFEALGDFEDAHARRIDIAVSITGIEDGEAALIAASGLTDEELERLNRLNERRGMLKYGILAVGNKHTCAVTAEGKVLAAGDNTYGQLKVDLWQNVVSVDCGAKHTAALLADGTVVAAGDNTYGQTEVSGWKNVVKIAAGAFDTYALTSDGKVLHTGFSDDKNITGWEGITDICAGSYAVGGLYGNGSMLSNEESCALTDASGLIMTDVSTAFGVGLLKTGQAQATFGELGWNDCVYISAGGAGVLGIDLDGRVLSHFFRNTDSFAFGDMDAVSVAAGGGHHAVLLSDGSVKVFGSNEYGQANTSGWNLFG